MTFYVENETKFDFSNFFEEMVKSVIMETAQSESFQFPFEVNLLITNNEGIKTYNKKFRGIDKETDVLSFPNLEFEIGGSFDFLNNPVNKADYFNPESGEVILGDIIISYEKVVSQALEYGHSIEREFCFLITHSMLHLFGYDHIDALEAEVMEKKQNGILNKQGILRK